MIAATAATTTSRYSRASSTASTQAPATLNGVRTTVHNVHAIIGTLRRKLSGMALCGATMKGIDSTRALMATVVTGTEMVGTEMIRIMETIHTETAATTTRRLTPVTSRA